MVDSSYLTKVYMEQGGDRQVVASGGSFDVESGGEVDFESGAALKLAGTEVTASAAELNVTDGATAGLPVASKAVILDASKEFSMRSAGHIDVGRSRFALFDDFLKAAIDATNNWIVFGGDDAAADAAATVTAPEGKVNMGSAGAGAADDGTVLSLILAAKGSLVSLGMTVFECRVSFDQLTGTSWNFGLSDILAEATERSIFTINSGTVADVSIASGAADCIMFGFSSDATATDKWQFCHMNNSVVGNSGAEDAHTGGPTADTYAVLRIEVDADGDCRFYIDGVLVKSETTAVRTTAVLIPFIGGNSADDADVATIVSVDYIYFSGVRPSSNA